MMIFPFVRVVACASAFAGLPEAWAPFERSECARREVDVCRKTYKRGPNWGLSRAEYPWVEYVSGDKSVMVAGNDSRIPGSGMHHFGWLEDGISVAGFGHLAIYADKGGPLRLGNDYLGQVYVEIIDDDCRRQVASPKRKAKTTICFGPKDIEVASVRTPSQPIFGDSLAFNEKTGVATLSRPWTVAGVKGVFSYTVRAAGAGLVKVDWAAGVDMQTWNKHSLGDRIRVRLDVPKDRPAPARIADGAWELGSGEPTRLVSVRLTQDGPVGSVLFDLHESRVQKRAGQPAVGGIDFWGDDAYDVPIRASRNQMFNGNFEQGFKGWRFLRGAWQDCVTNAYQDLRFTELSTDAKFGRYSLRLDRHGKKVGLPALKSAPMALTPGKTYTLSCWGKADATGCSMTVAPAAENWGDDVKWPGGVKPNLTFPIGTNWTHYAVTFIAPRTGTHVELWHGGGAAYNIDGVMVEEGDQATDFVADPVEARLETVDAFNYLYPSVAPQAKVELTGQPGLSGVFRVSVENVYHERVYERETPFALDAGGFASEPLDDLDAKKVGLGVFVIRFDFTAGDARWHDFSRFTIIDPLRGVHPLAPFFMHFNWFAGGENFFVISSDFCSEMNRRTIDWGIGSRQDSTFEYQGRQPWAAVAERLGQKPVVSTVLGHFGHLEPEEFGWGKPNYYLRATTNATPALVKKVEEIAYAVGLKATPDDNRWAFAGEDELHSLIVKRKAYEEYFSLQQAAWRGLKRAFDERGLKLYYAPSQGTASFNGPETWDVLEGMLKVAQNHGFRYDFLTAHFYAAVDGSVLGPYDREKAIQKLIEIGDRYGYKGVPIYVPECFNMLPMHIPAWGANDWADNYHGEIPSHAFSNRETIQAGVMMRLYLMDLKYWPRLGAVNTWQHKPIADICFTPYAWTMTMNTLGRLMPDPRFVGMERPYPDVRAYCFRPTPDATDAILAVWTSNNDVENGYRKGDVLEMALPTDVVFYDMMGNKRTPSCEQVGLRDVSYRVPMTPLPLFIRSKDAEGLLRAVREAKGGTGDRAERKSNIREIGVNACGATQPWKNHKLYPVLALTNGVTGAVSAEAQFAWSPGGKKLFIRVTVKGAKAPTLDIRLDGLANARDIATRGLGLDDCAFRVTDAKATLVHATNTQYRDGGSSADFLTDEETDRTLQRKWTPTLDGGVWTVVFTPRFISPVRFEHGVRFGLDLSVSAIEGGASLSPSDEPADYPRLTFR